MPSSFQIIHAVDHSVSVLKDNQLLVEYHYKQVNRFPYCHPVNLLDGPTVSLCHPYDHDWHMGMFFSWKYLNGFNVWEGSDSNEAYGATSDVALHVIADHDDGAGFWHQINWTTSAGERLLQDQRIVLVKSSSISNAYCIDWIFTFVPLVEEITFERKVEWGGYAGLSVRLPRSFYQPRILNANGDTQSQVTHSARASWTDYSGWLDGLGRKAWGGIAMLDHPQNYRHPTPWLTYDTPHLQFLNAAFLRDEPYTLYQGDSLMLAYRAVVHWEQGDRNLLDAEASLFSQIDPKQVKRDITARLEQFHRPNHDQTS
jgi:hypothetical protein